MRSVLFTTIPSGYAVSSPVDLNQFTGLKSVFVPTIDSGDMLIQGSFDTTSANFVRLLAPTFPGSAFMRFCTLVGSLMLSVPQDYSFPPYVRLETINAQTNTRSFTLLAARW